MFQLLQQSWMLPASGLFSDQKNGHAGAEEQSNKGSKQQLALAVRVDLDLVSELSHAFP